MKMCEGNIPVHVAILDFSKVFDKLPHGHMIKKLIKASIDITIIRWIENFLFDRFVVVEEGVSNLLAVTLGVPQGSVFGPALFFVDINDRCDKLSKSTIGLFADEALLYCLVSDRCDTFLFQSELNMYYK